MPIHKVAAAKGLGRKSAYVARNRAALLRSTQRVLAEIGPEASIDQFAEAAEIAISTIYTHFENKEALIAAANIEAFRDWQDWTDQFLHGIKDPIEELVLPMRLFLRLGKTHPHYAGMIARNVFGTPKYFPQIEESIYQHVNELTKAKILNVENPAIRIRSVSACIFAGLSNQLLNPKAKEADADATIEVILGILGVSSAKAKKVANAPMPDISAHTPRL